MMAEPQGVLQARQEEWWSKNRAQQISVSSPRTDRMPVLLALPMKFSAKQVYLPSSDRLMFLITNVPSEVTVTLCQGQRESATGSPWKGIVEEEGSKGREERGRGRRGDEEKEEEEKKCSLGGVGAGVFLGRRKRGGIAGEEEMKESSWEGGREFLGVRNLPGKEGEDCVLGEEGECTYRGRVF